MRGDAGFPVRLRFSKHGKVRFVGHRDVARAFERAFRIVELPLAFTQGFSPRPKVSFGLALSVGHESDAEYLDVELTRADRRCDDVPERLTAALPDGIEVTGVAALDDRAPALQEAVTAVGWQLEVTGPEGDGPEPLDVSAPRGRGDGSTELAHDPDAQGQGVTGRRPARLPARRGARRVRARSAPRGRGRDAPRRRPRRARFSPRSGGGLEARRVLRTGQWIERGGARLEPLAADPRRAVEARAS